MSMMQSGVELTITTFGTLLIAGAEAHDYSLVQKVSSASTACMPLPNITPMHQYCSQSALLASMLLFVPNLRVWQKVCGLKPFVIGSMFNCTVVP